MSTNLTKEQRLAKLDRQLVRCNDKLQMCAQDSNAPCVRRYTAKKAELEQKREDIANS